MSCLNWNNGQPMCTLHGRCFALLTICFCLCIRAGAQDSLPRGVDTPQTDTSHDSTSQVVARVHVDSVASLAYDSVTVPLRQPTERQLQDAMRGDDYTYDRAKKPMNFTWLDWLKNWLERRFIPNPFTKTGSTIINIILYAAIIALVVLVGMWLSKTGFRGLIKGADKNINMLDEEMVEDIQEMPLDQLIEGAAARAEYRRAVRYLFLRELKSLAQKEIISWSGYKTNSDYRSEIHDPELRERFRKLCHAYEAVWYGEHLPDAHSFAELRGVFDEFGAASERHGSFSIAEVSV